MNMIEWNAKRRETVLKEIERDMSKILEVKKMMASDGWAYLMEFSKEVREQMFQACKEASILRTKKETCPERVAMVWGWDLHTDLADSLVRQADKFIKEQKELE